MATESQIWQVEESMEKEFLRILTPVCDKVFRSRQKGEAQSPWVEIIFLVGEVNIRHEHLFPDYQDCCYDTWNSQLQVAVVTQRQNNGSRHPVILGNIRSALQRYKLAPNWQNETARALEWTDPIHVLVDIREQGTVHANDSEIDTDTSTMTFSVVHQVRASAWPIDN